MTDRYHAVVGTDWNRPGMLNSEEDQNTRKLPVPVIAAVVLVAAGLGAGTIELLLGGSFLGSAVPVGILTAVIASVAAKSRKA